MIKFTDIQSTANSILEIIIGFHKLCLANLNCKHEDDKNDGDAMSTTTIVIYKTHSLSCYIYSVQQHPLQNDQCLLHCTLNTLNNHFKK